MGFCRGGGGVKWVTRDEGQVDKRIRKRGRGA